MTALDVLPLSCLQLRQVSRRGSFFWRKPPSGVPKKGFGKMMQQVRSAGSVD